MKRKPPVSSVLAAILLSGTLLRLFRLGADSLWYDETVSTFLAGSPLPELIRHTAGDIHPPGYYLLLRGWLMLMGYPTGRTDPDGIGLEFAARFFSLFFGVALIALIYAFAKYVAGRRVALVAAALVAVSPFNVWYGQEVRMYTVAAGLGVVVMYALMRAQKAEGSRQGAGIRWWSLYAIAAVGGMYTLYYFAFLLIPLNLWAAARLLMQRWHRRQPPTHQALYNGGSSTDRIDSSSGNRQSPIRNPQPPMPWLLANLAALALYAPWIPMVWRQATDPPVPPWRTPPALWTALLESWTALSLGQSAPAWLWPILLLTLLLYVVGIVALGYGKRQMASDKRPSAICHPSSTIRFLPLATFGPLGLILLASLVTPLYHVRYLFTYSPAFFVVLAAGLVWLWQEQRLVAGLASVVWLAAAGITLAVFWTGPAYRSDDHRAAVRFLQSHWAPGDVVLVNAGWPYTALLTYWDGPVAFRGRLTGDLPGPRNDAALVVVTAGHVDGDPTLGWADPRSDFFAMPADAARRQVGALFARFPRVWHYRIYDTVNDPDAAIRGWLAEDGVLFDDQLFSGEAYLRVQGLAPRAGATWSAEGPTFRYAAGVSLQAGPLPQEIEAGRTLYAALVWRADREPSADIATSLRLIGPDGDTWSQPSDEQPLGPLYRSSAWPVGQAQSQPLALPIPAGTPPGAYTIALLVYEPATGGRWSPLDSHEQLPAVPEGLELGTVRIVRPEPAPAPQPALARFGPLALIEASSPATVVSPGDQVPVELLWQAIAEPGEPLVVVVQLLGEEDLVIASLEEEPAKRLHPTQGWAVGELVRDRHTLEVPQDVPPGRYRFIVGVYRAADRVRLARSAGLFGSSDYFVIKGLEVTGR